MASSERIDRSTFSRTCSLLSQYVKENSGFGDLTLGLLPSDAPVENRGTLDLLTKIEKPVAGDSKERAPLTIFYAGEVFVFDNFPAEKANGIMALAGRFGGPRTPAAPTTAESASSSPYFFPSNLPMARKNSLARFLAKRKDRNLALAPYQSSNKKSTPVKAEPWLGLGPGPL